jgi:CheY-like chemotaxis protein
MPDESTILIVDDEPDLCEMLMFEFSAKGYRALAVPDGRQALNLVASQPVDVVISDIRMPHIDGFELLARLKSANVHRPIMVLMSAYADVSLEEAHGRGAEALFSKPFRLADLEDAVYILLQPAAERWARPPALPPMQSLQLHASSFDAGCEQQILGLGRGGIYLSTPEIIPFPSQPVAFAIDLDAGPLTRLAGTGMVHWCRTPKSPSAPSWCGIAFEYLEDSCREAIVQWIETEKPMPFIPRPGME